MILIFIEQQRKVALVPEKSKNKNKNNIFYIYSDFPCLAKEKEVSGFILEEESNSAQRNIHRSLNGLNS